MAGWGFGFGFFFAGLYWIGFAFLVEADKFAWLMPLGGGRIARRPGAVLRAGGLRRRSRSGGRGRRASSSSPPPFSPRNGCAGHILTGFPWNLWGYAFAGSGALAQTASIFGIYSLTSLALLIVASPAALAGSTARQAREHWPLPAICLVLLAAAGYGGGAARRARPTRCDAEVKLRIVQPNIPQADKWKPENRQWIFDRLLELSRKGRARRAGSGPESTHLIWPETSVPFLFMLNGEIAAPEARKAFADLVGDGTTFIVGAERVEGTKRQDGRYNVEPRLQQPVRPGRRGTSRGIYDKVHLVPFGEYVPFEENHGGAGHQAADPHECRLCHGHYSVPLMTHSGRAALSRR